MSLEETKELVDGYEERHPVTAARSATVDTTVDGPYHNSDHLYMDQKNNNTYSLLALL